MLTFLNNLQRGLIIFVACLSLVLGGTTGLASAHLLEQNNGISAVLHMPPDDNPQAGQITKLYLSFGNSANQFRLQNCTCQVSIKNNGRTLLTTTPQPAQNGAPLNSVASITFPAIGVYDVIVIGSAKNGEFQAFQLDYLVRVATATASRSTMTQNSGGTALMISAGSLLILGIFAYIAIQHGSRYSSLSKPTPSNNKSKKKPK